MNIIQKQMNLRRIAQIADRQLRNVLISTAKAIEDALKTGPATIATKFCTTTPYGLSIEVLVDDKGNDKPMLFTFIYNLSIPAMQTWLRNNMHLCEGCLTFLAKGIEIVIPYGPDKVDKSAFSIDDSESKRIWLPLLTKSISFCTHRNVFGGEEWECFYNEVSEESEPSESVEKSEAASASEQDIIDKATILLDQGLTPTVPEDDTPF